MLEKTNEIIYLISLLGKIRYW